MRGPNAVAMSSTQSSPASHGSHTSDVPAEWLQVPLRRLDLNEPAAEPDPQETHPVHTGGLASATPARASTAQTCAGPAAAQGASRPCGAGTSSSSGPPATAAAAGPQNPVNSPAPTQFAEPRPGNVHCYAVWRTSGQRDIRGVHIGGSLAWSQILHSLPNAEYSPMERLRRFPSEAEAVAGYAAEARRHGAPMPPPLFRY